MFPSAEELGAFIATSDENDLSDHPAWPSVRKLSAEQLRPGGDDAYDLDEVYTWAAGEPDPIHVSALANVVDMVAKIADCCDDGALRSLVSGTPAYEELVDEDVSYQGRDGRKRWAELGDVIADSWERAIARVEQWLSWQGDFDDNTELDAETIWDRVGAEPIEIVLPDATYLTVRGYGAHSGEDIATDHVGRPRSALRGRRGALPRPATATSSCSITSPTWPSTAASRPGTTWSGSNGGANWPRSRTTTVFTPAAERQLRPARPVGAGPRPRRRTARLLRPRGRPRHARRHQRRRKIDRKAWDAVVAEIETCLQPEDDA